MAAKTWDKDFRSEAIQASLRLVDSEQREDLFQAPVSFCLPVAGKPIVGWTPGWFMLIALVLGFLLLGAGAVLGSLADKHKDGPASVFLLVVAVVCSLSGIATFILPLKCDRHIVRRLLGNRGRQLSERADRTPLLVAEVTNADRSSMKISISGDDYALIFPDEVNRRILMEGIGARYQIRAEDVDQVLPFQFMNYLGVEIVYRIGTETRLRLAIARPSLLLEFVRQAPILFFMRSWVPNRLLGRLSETLGRAVTQPDRGKVP
jgi:hypothetical protein